MLSGGFRVLATVQAVLLLLSACVLLARTGLWPVPVQGSGALAWTTWAMVAFLAANTAANLTAPHPLERWGTGSVTLTLSGLCPVHHRTGTCAAEG